MKATTCSVCGRAVYDVHVDGKGRCCYCGGVAPTLQKADAARPAESKQPAPPLNGPTEAEWADLGRPKEPGEPR